MTIDFFAAIGAHSLLISDPQQKKVMAALEKSKLVKSSTTISFLKNLTFLPSLFLDANR